MVENELEEKTEIVPVNTSAELEEAPGEEKKKRGFAWLLRDLAVYFLVIFLCITIVPRYIVQRTEVDGESMRDTLYHFDNLLVEKVSYYFRDPDRFDIVTLYPQGRDEPEYYIKRIIGLPGENVRIDGNHIYINGKLLEEHYGKETVIKEGGIAGTEEGITLKNDEYFVMGDNRNHSVDSRFLEEVGPVKKKNIDGHAVFRICSFKKKKGTDGSIVRGGIDFSTFGILK